MSVALKYVPNLSIINLTWNGICPTQERILANALSQLPAFSLYHNISNSFYYFSSILQVEAKVSMMRILN